MSSSTFTAAWLGALATAASAAPFIEVNPDSLTALREKGTGKAFVSVGVNYFDPQTGWAPKLWQKFDEGRVTQQLDLLAEAGFNTIRVFLTYESFHREPGQLHPEGLAKFRTLLRLCEARGIRVIPSGPDHWEGTPPWRQGADQYADERLLKADEAWWAAFAKEFADEPVLLAYDLYNEPMIGWDSPPMVEKWNAWLRKGYGGLDNLARSWNRPADSLGEWGKLPAPPAKTALGDTRLYDFQCFRESVGNEWTARLAAAIRSADRNHMVTVGHIQWAAPVFIQTVQTYAGFNLKSNAKHVDFTTIHFYPLDTPRPCDSPEGIAANKAYFEAVLYQASVGKPLMIGEFNWYGGGGLEVESVWKLPAKPVEHQGEWCRELLASSRGRACGWLNWAMADVPGAMDITRWSGLWTTDFQLKPWGREFSEFARRATAAPPPKPRAFPAAFKRLDDQRKALLTDPAAGHELRKTMRK